MDLSSSVVTFTVPPFLIPQRIFLCLAVHQKAFRLRRKQRWMIDDTNMPSCYYLTFMQKSQRSFPRPSVMLLSQISF